MSGAILDIANYIKEYASTTVMKAVDSTTLASGETVMVLADPNGGLYRWNPISDEGNTSAIAADDGLGFWIPETRAYIYVDSSGIISPLNVGNSSLDLDEGNMYIGNSLNVASALDISGDGRLVVGNGTTATSVAVTGDISLTNAGVTAVTSLDLETATVTNIADTEFLIGTGAGTANFAVFSGDVTVANTGAATVAALDLETATVTNIADTEIMVGDGAGSAAFVSLSQDATMANTGAVTVVSAQGNFETGAGGTGTVINSGITTSSGAAAVPVTGRLHAITTTGTGDALTLANGTDGQQLTLIYVAEGAGGDTAVLTPTTLAGGTTITFNALGDSADLTYYSTGGWYMHGGTAAIA